MMITIVTMIMTIKMIIITIITIIATLKITINVNS